MNKSHPTISVIIPTYNREKLIAASIDSVLAQTFRDFEIIVIDDGSTDGTADVASRYGTRIRYVPRANEGRSAARNYALSIARGRFIAFLDSDDLYLPGKLALQVEYLENHPDVGMIYTSAYCIDENGNRLPHVYEASVSGHIYEQVAFYVPVTITLPTVIARREVFEAVGVFDVAMDRFEDTDMWRRIAKEFEIAALPEKTCLLRTHMDNSLQQQEPLRLLKAVEYYTRKVFAEDSAVGWRILRKGAGRLNLFYAKALLSLSGNGAIGCRLLLKSIAFDPLHFYRIAYLFYYPVRRLVRRVRQIREKR
jgi:glycosyltransferase involved in cell wall biosynthesis